MVVSRGLIQKKKISLKLAGITAHSETLSASSFKYSLYEFEFLIFKNRLHLLNSEH